MQPASHPAQLVPQAASHGMRYIQLPYPLIVCTHSRKDRCSKHRFTRIHVCTQSTHKTSQLGGLSANAMHLALAGLPADAVSGTCLARSHKEEGAAAFTCRSLLPMQPPFTGCLEVHASVPMVQERLRRQHQTLGALREKALHQLQQRQEAAATQQQQQLGQPSSRALDGDTVALRNNVNATYVRMGMGNAGYVVGGGGREVGGRGARGRRGAKGRRGARGRRGRGKRTWAGAHTRARSRAHKHTHMCVSAHAQARLPNAL